MIRVFFFFFSLILSLSTPESQCGHIPLSVKPDLTRPTIAYTLHVASEVHDNSVWRMRKESESSQTVECSSLALKKKKSPDEVRAKDPLSQPPTKTPT